MDRFLESIPRDIEFELIDVISNRLRSDEIAQQFDVEHESPQVIVIDENNNVVWAGSHRIVTEENLNQAIKENKNKWWIRIRKNIAIQSFLRYNL